MQNENTDQERATIIRITKNRARKKAVELLCKFSERMKSMHAILREYITEESPSADLFMMVQALTMSVIRFLNTIDFLISRSRPSIRFKELPEPERNAIRLAVYEGRWIGTPVKVLEKQYLTGFNHLSRSLRRAIKVDLDKAVASLPDIESLGIQFAHPSFLVKTLIDNMGRNETIQLMQANLGPRSYYVRPNQLKYDSEKISEALSQTGIEVVPDSEVPGIFKVVQGADKIVRSSIFRNGLMLIQDKASVLTAKSLNPQPGDVIWDACAAPGMKTQLLWEMMHRKGRLIASDIHPSRLRTAAHRSHMLGYEEVTWILADASMVPVRDADKILIDAPCTSTGILRSRPSFKWKLNKKYLMSIMSIQHKILEGIMKIYADKPGTELIYATCSLLPHEGENQIDSMMSRYDVEFMDIPIANASPGYPGHKCSNKVRRLFPHVHDTSGFFIARFRIL